MLTFESPSPKDVLSQVWLKLAQWFRIFNISLLYRVPLSEQNLNSLHPIAMLLCLVNISPAVLEKNIFKFYQCIFAIPLLSFLEKGRGLLFEKKILEFPVPTDGLICAKFGWNCPSGSKEDENLKRLQTDGETDRQTDRRRTTDDHAEKTILTFQPRWAKTFYLQPMCSQFSRTLRKTL